MSLPQPTTEYTPYRSSKRALAVRMLIAKTAWLDGQLRWQSGRVVWEQNGIAVAPGVAELSIAQHCHFKIRRYPISADLVLGDHQAWLAYRAARLELAKRLRSLGAPDLPELARRALAGNQEAALRLTELLTAEALCYNRLPVSPAETLAACGVRVAALLVPLVSDEEVPFDARALAALVLGSMQYSSNEWQVTPRLWRVYQWGRAHGLPVDPPAFITLLLAEDGPELARRYTAASSIPAPFATGESFLRALLRAGVAPHTIIALAESCALAVPVGEQLLTRREGDRTSRAQREEAARQLANVMHTYLLRTHEPASVALLVQFADAMLNLADLGTLPLDSITAPLRAGLELPPALSFAVLELLVERHERLWDRASFTRRKKDPQLQNWLHDRLHHEVKPMLRLLESSGDVAIVHEALALGVYRPFQHNHFPEPKFYQWLLTLVRAFDPEPTGTEITPAMAKDYAEERADIAYECCAMLNLFSDFEAARAVLRPFFDAIMAAPQKWRSCLVRNIGQELRRIELLNRDSFGRVARRMPHLVAFVRKSTHSYQCSWFLLGLIALDRYWPEQADPWLAWLVAHLLECEQRLGDEIGASISIAALFAVTLAHGEFALFQTIFHAAIQHRFSQGQDLLEKNIPVLARYPGLRRALARIFPQQPQRCADLTLRVGAAVRLDTNLLEPLELLEPYKHTDQRELHALHTSYPDWHDLLEVAPELAASAAEYLYSQWLRGGDMAVPPGVRQSIGQPQKLARELAHLERLVLEHPERADLRIRVTNLRTRLGQETHIMASARQDAAERLAQISAQAQLAAAEQQVLECYRLRLEYIAGISLPHITVDDDLLNAVQLSLDIDHNRKLLRQLLRAHLSGDRGWRERVPANAAWLAQLAGQGIDPASWLCEWPRRYRCAGVTGGSLRLHLEQSPIKILQMGNLFGTCLSLGGINSFSTVVNACDLNKRVIYARDGAGRVIARKLIAISDTGKLLGFRTYTSSSGDTTRAAIWAIVLRYTTSFARHCGLELADHGEVPTLLAKEWYDDGCVSWNEDATTKDTKVTE